MDSISKTPIDRDRAAAAARAAFGDDAVLADVTECDEGWFNAVHRLELVDGRRGILKVAPPAGIRVLRYEHDLITTEVDALRLVGDRTTVPVPGVLTWDPSCSVLPSPYFVMEECNGTLLSTLRPTLSADDAASVDAQLARIVAQINAITADTFGRPEPTARRHRTWSDAFTELVTDLLADAADAVVQLPVLAASLEELVRTHRHDLDEVTTPRLVDWDLWDANVFVDPDTLQVVGVIDLERVLWADPLMEAQFIGHRADGPVTEAYGHPLFAASGAVARRRLYDVYLYLVMVIESAYRNYPDDHVEQLARPMLDSVLGELGLAPS